MMKIRLGSWSLKLGAASWGPGIAMGFVLGLAALALLGASRLERSPLVIPGITAGRVLFSDGTKIAGDSNLVWDNTNKRLNTPYLGGQVTANNSAPIMADFANNGSGVGTGATIRFGAGAFGLGGNFFGTISAFYLGAGGPTVTISSDGSGELMRFYGGADGGVNGSVGIRVSTSAFLTEQLVIPNAKYLGGVNAGGTATLKLIGLDASDDPYAPNSIKLGDPGAKPTCASARRGLLWHDYGGAGVKDTVEICAKDAADAYAWRVLY